MLRLERQRQALNLDEYRRRSAAETDYADLITESALIYEGDTLQIAYLELRQLGEDLATVDAALDRITYETNYRTSGLKTTSRIFGWRPRNTIRADYCSATSMAFEQPAEHAIIARAGDVVAKYYREYNPDLYGKHAAITNERVRDEYHLEDEVFTSGIINKNNPLKYHFDAGNFKDVWSGMLVFKRDVGGGYLSVPQFGMAFELKDWSLLLFDGQSLLHGVTPIEKLSTSARRYSIVYYSLQQMWNCAPLGDEVARIRKLRTTREEKRV